MHPSLHVLLVDDDSEIRKLLGRYLTEQGFRVSLAGSKREFGERLSTEKFDIIGSDYAVGRHGYGCPKMR